MPFQTSGKRVKTTHPRFDQKYLDSKHAQLMRQRDELLATIQQGKGEDATVNDDIAAEPHENEDDAQRLAVLEIDSTLIARNRAHIARFDRALQKLADGTYGLSDASGDEIPVERLDATPDAVYTVAEQQKLDSRGS